MMTLRKIVYVGPKRPVVRDDWSADYTDSADLDVLKKSAKIKKRKRLRGGR